MVRNVVGHTVGVYGSPKSVVDAVAGYRISNVVVGVVVKDLVPSLVGSVLVKVFANLPLVTAEDVVRLVLGKVGIVVCTCPKHCGYYVDVVGIHLV